MVTGPPDENMLLTRKEFGNGEKIKNKNKIASLVSMKKGKLRKRLDGSGNIFNFIDESFENILYTRIKSQVKKELEVLLSDENLLSINSKLSKDVKHNDSNDHRLIATLQSEVDFLRNEILTKK